MSTGKVRKRFTGIAWFAMADWEELEEFILDQEMFAQGYDGWRAQTNELINSLEETGFTVQKVHVEPEEFATWCRFRGQTPNATAVRLYVAERIKPTEDARRVDGRRRQTQAATPEQPKASGPAEMTARQRVAQMRPDLAALLPTPV